MFAHFSELLHLNIPKGKSKYTIVNMPEINISNTQIINRGWPHSGSVISSLPEKCITCWYFLNKTPDKLNEIYEKATEVEVRFSGDSFQLCVYNVGTFNRQCVLKKIFFQEKRVRMWNPCGFHVGRHWCLDHSPARPGPENCIRSFEITPKTDSNPRNYFTLARNPPQTQESNFHRPETWPERKLIDKLMQ